MRHQFHSAFPLAAFLALFLFFSSCGEKADSTGDSTGFTPERVAALPDGGCLLVTSVPKADPPQQSLVRMDAQGKRLWETNIPGDIGGSDHHESPIVAGGGKAIIRVGGLKADAGAEQKIIAYDLESGEKRWERPAASMFRSMVVRGEHLVVVPVFLSKNALEVLQLSDGNVAWTYQLPEKYGRDEVRVLEKHVSYFGEGTDTLMLFDLTNGKMVFSTHGLSPTYDGNRLFYGTSSGIVA
ncbi:MAG: PQQ-binding-like beta-propeller repeat protein, partial [Bacteroidota bacterium]